MRMRELADEHDAEIERSQEQLKRERARASEDRAHFEREAEQVRRVANERALAEIERIKEVEENKRKTLTKKHAVKKIYRRIWQILVFNIGV